MPKRFLPLLFLDSHCKLNFETCIAKARGKLDCERCIGKARASFCIKFYMSCTRQHNGIPRKGEMTVPHALDQSQALAPARCGRGR